MWPNTQLLERFGIEIPVVQAPMAGPVFSDMVIAVAEAGGLGSLPCATMGFDQLRREFAAVRRGTAKPVNVNFFCHATPTFDADREAAWRERLRPYHVELGLDPDVPVPPSNRMPFDDEACALVEELRPEVVSFHFGLPEQRLVDRVRATGAVVLSSATSVAEARWLEDHGCDVVIAQGVEAGGHRGMFLTDDIATQLGTFALVPQVVDAVRVPVIAAGGIADARGIVAAFVLGAAAVQIGTAYLFTPEARVAAPHRKALLSERTRETALTNVFTGRPARGILNRLMREVGPMTDLAPTFPLAGGALARLRAATEGIMTATYVIRRLRTGDDALYEPMLDLFGEAFEDEDSYRSARPGRVWRRRLLSADHFVALVALDGNSVVGALAGYELMKFEQERSEFYIYDLAVAETHRRRGIATDLINAFRQIALERDGWVVFVQADYADPPAIALYESLGTREEVLHFDISPAPKP